MHLGQISLCDSTAFNIKSDDDKSKILRELDAFSVKIIKKHHDTFAYSRHVDVINRNPFLVGLRSNGNPYYLYLTRCNFVNQCILVDKKVQQGYFYPRMIMVRLSFEDSLFDNTLFEGEMIKDKHGRWLFLISDVLAVRNGGQDDVNLVKRINMVYDILSTGFVPDDHDIFRLEVKRYLLPSQLSELVHSFMPRLPYTCRGVYFKPFFYKFRDILFNFDDSLVKKIVRTNYKDQCNFLLMQDQKDLIAKDNTPVYSSSSLAPGTGGHAGVSAGHVHNDPTPATVSHPYHTESAPPDQPPTLQQQEQEQDVRMFWARNTNLPDVYELYETSNEAIKGAASAVTPPNRIACIPSLKVSKYLRSLFTNRGVTDIVPMECVYSKKFDKWTPVRVKQ